MWVSTMQNLPGFFLLAKQAVYMGKPSTVKVGTVARYPLLLPPSSLFLNPEIFGKVTDNKSCSGKIRKIQRGCINATRLRQGDREKLPGLCHSCTLPLCLKEPHPVCEMLLPLYLSSASFKAISVVPWPRGESWGVARLL